MASQQERGGLIGWMQERGRRRQAEKGWREASATGYNFKVTAPDGGWFAGPVLPGSVLSQEVQDILHVGDRDLARPVKGAAGTFEQTVPNWNGDEQMVNVEWSVGNSASMSELRDRLALERTAMRDSVVRREAANEFLQYHIYIRHSGDKEGALQEVVSVLASSLKKIKEAQASVKQAEGVMTNAPGKREQTLLSGRIVAPLLDQIRQEMLSVGDILLQYSANSAEEAHDFARTGTMFEGLADLDQEALYRRVDALTEYVDAITTEAHNIVEDMVLSEKKREIAEKMLTSLNIEVGADFSDLPEVEVDNLAIDLLRGYKQLGDAYERSLVDTDSTDESDSDYSEAPEFSEFVLQQLEIRKVEGDLADLNMPVADFFAEARAATSSSSRRQIGELVRLSERMAELIAADETTGNAFQGGQFGEHYRLIAGEGMDQLVVMIEAFLVKMEEELESGEIKPADPDQPLVVEPSDVMTALVDNLEDFDELVKDRAKEILKG